MDIVFQWLSINWFETIAALLGLIGIFLQIKQNAWYWAISIVMVLMYIVVFFESKFYADMSFQFYYLVISFYGLYYWITKKSTAKKKTINTSKLTGKAWVISIMISIILFVLIYIILEKFTDSDVAIGDAFTTALSFVATWLLARKVLENWLFWIIVDAVSTSLYIYKGLYPTAILFFVLTILAFYGYFIWKKSLVDGKN
jgi:nicotinamide mononucleotide transporter